MKRFTVPKSLEEAFKSFLDTAQFHFADTNDPNLSTDEQKVLRLVRKYLGRDLSTRSK